MKNIRIFIASPGDVAEERDIASIVVAEINRIFGETFGVNLDAVRWETHAWPEGDGISAVRYVRDQFTWNTSDRRDPIKRGSLVISCEICKIVKKDSVPREG